MIVPPPEPSSVTNDLNNADKSSAGDEGLIESVDPGLVLGICAITGLAVLLAVGIYCYFKHVKGKFVDAKGNGTKILADTNDLSELR